MFTYKPSKYRTLFHNSKITRSGYPSALPLLPKVGFIPVNPSSLATLHAEIYKSIFKTLTCSSDVSEPSKESARKSKESANAIKWRQSVKCVEWVFPHYPLWVIFLCLNKTQIIMQCLGKISISDEFSTPCFY